MSRKLQGQWFPFSHQSREFIKKIRGWRESALSSYLHWGQSPQKSFYWTLAVLSTASAFRLAFFLSLPNIFWMIFFITGASGSRQTSFWFFSLAMTSTVGHCGPAGITSKLAINLGLIFGVTVKQTQRSSVAAMTEEGAASARCCGSVNSNRNASGAIRMNGEMEPLGMRAELRSWRLIVDKIPDQGAPARDMLEEVWRLGLYRALWCSQTHCTPFICSLSSFRQETGAWRCWGNSLDLELGGGGLRGAGQWDWGGRMARRSGSLPNRRRMLVVLPREQKAAALGQTPLEDLSLS